eukprot:m.104562 g.104562  ORF g.104562 m.104562 type:complete len:464 (-) comp9111_c8_seq7:1223-2614(-)
MGNDDDHSSKKPKMASNAFAQLSGSKNVFSSTSTSSSSSSPFGKKKSMFANANKTTTNSANSAFTKAASGLTSMPWTKQQKPKSTFEAASLAQSNQANELKSSEIESSVSSSPSAINPSSNTETSEKSKPTLMKVTSNPFAALANKGKSSPFGSKKSSSIFGKKATPFGAQNLELERSPSTTSETQDALEQQIDDDDSNSTRVWKPPTETNTSDTSESATPASSSNSGFAKISQKSDMNAFQGTGESKSFGNSRSLFAKGLSGSNSPALKLQHTSASEQTGMENDNVYFKCLSKLYMFTKEADDKHFVWHERGRGTLYLTDPKEGDTTSKSSSSRLLMWADNTKRLILNGLITSSSTVKKQADNTVCISLLDSSDSSTTLKTFSIKMKKENAARVLKEIEERIEKAKSADDLKEGVEVTEDCLKEGVDGSVETPIDNESSSPVNAEGEIETKKEDVNEGGIEK